MPVDINQNLLNEMQHKNNAIKDSLNLIITQLSFKDSLYKLERDSLRNRLEIIQSISNGLNTKMVAITRRIDQNIGTSWNDLTEKQKDSIIASSIKPLKP